MIIVPSNVSAAVPGFTSTKTITATSPRGLFGFSSSKLYGIVDGGVAVINTSTDAITKTISITTGSISQIKGTGTKIFVGDGGDTKVHIIDTSSDTKTGSITTSATNGYSLAVNSTVGYTTQSSSSSIQVFNTTSNSFTKTLSTSKATSNQGGEIVGSTYYVGNTDGTLTLVSASTSTVTSTISAGVSYPSWMCSLGTYLYVGGTNASSTGGAVSVIDTGTNSVSATIDLGSGTWSPWLVAGETEVYCYNGGNRLTTIGGTTTTGQFDLGATNYAQGIGYSNGKVYISKGTGDILVISK